MLLPNEYIDSGGNGPTSAGFSVAHGLALNLEAVFNLTMTNALGCAAGGGFSGKGEGLW